jgi:NAD(P)-dependent dehydrogenase (short-subunit alcohol dehydrogenase family)
VASSLTDHQPTQTYDAKLTELWGGPAPKWFPQLWEAWPAEHGARMRGKVAIVTGGAAGIGFYITKMLVHLGAEVIVPWRVGFEEETAAAITAITAASVGGSVRMSKAPLDLTSFVSVREFAAACRKELPQLDLLCLNAGRGGSKGDPIEVTTDGCEAIVQVNALSHFLLTAELLPLLRASPEARVVSQSSGARKLFSPTSDVPRRLCHDLNATKEGARYDAFSQYVPSSFFLLFKIHIYV